MWHQYFSQFQQINNISRLASPPTCNLFWILATCQELSCNKFLTNPALFCLQLKKMAKVVCPDINDGFFGMSADDDDFYSDRAALEFKKRRVLVSYRMPYYVLYRAQPPQPRCVGTTPMRHLSWAHLTTASSETWAQGAARGISCSVAWLPAAHIKNLFKPLSRETRRVFYYIYWVKFSPGVWTQSECMAEEVTEWKNQACAKPRCTVRRWFLVLLKFAHLVFFWMLRCCCCWYKFGWKVHTPLAASSSAAAAGVENLLLSYITGRFFYIFISTLGWVLSSKVGLASLKQII
jgi:hypothetical protein